MHCPNCGKEIKEGAKFCGGCGTPVPTGEAPVIAAEEISVQAAEPERDVKPKKKVSAPVKVLIAVLSVLIVLGGVLLGINLFKKDTLCIICDEVTKNGEEYCEACIEKYTCQRCGEIDQDVEKDMCPECLHSGKYCKECGKNVEESFYCSDCIYELGDSENTCFLCRNELSDEEIFLIDGDGYFYCENCDTGNYCISCGGVIDAGDDDKICKYCADYCCYNCGDVIGEEEIASRNENDEPLCKNCEGTDTQTPEYDGEVCINCGIPVGEEGAYVDYEGEHWCNDCYVGNTNYSVNPGTVATCWFCGIDVDGRRVYRDSERDFWCVKCAVENGEGMAY